MLILREDVASIEDLSWAADWNGDKRYVPLTRQLQAPRRNFAQLNFTPVRRPTPFDPRSVYQSVMRTVSKRSTSYPAIALTLLFLHL
jgi:hypothetical protein